MTGAGTLLVRDASLVATLDDERSEVPDASILVRGNRIEAIGPASALPRSADDVVDARGHLVVPGLVNAHHHMYQSLTRALRAAQDAELFSWLPTRGASSSATTTARQARCSTSRSRPAPPSP